MGSDDPLFKFTNVPLPELCLEPTSSGPIKSSWRGPFEMEIEQIEMNWPKVDLGEKILQKKEKNQNEKHRNYQTQQKENQEVQVVVHL